MKKRNKCLVFLFVFLPLFLFSAEEKKGDKKERFEFASDKTSVRLSEGKEYTLLSGNARVLSGATVIRADKIELYGKDFNIALCTGNVTVKDSDKGIYLRCQELYYDRKAKISRIESYAEMIDKENNLVVKGNFLEDSSEKEVTIIQIGVRIFKEDIVCRSEYARYDRKTKILELTGSPFVIKKGDEYRASRILINVDTDEITLEGDVSGRLAQEKKRKGKEPAVSPTKPGEAGKTATEKKEDAPASGPAVSPTTDTKKEGEQP